MVRRRSFISMEGLAVTGSCSMVSPTLASSSAPLPWSRAIRTSLKVSIPTTRPWSITTSEPMLCWAMTETASVSLPSGAMVKSALPLTLRISLTCMASPSCCLPHGIILSPSESGKVVCAGATKVRRYPMRFDWSKMGRTPPVALVEARNLAHHAAQWPAKAARANLSAVPDDSHSAFTWDASHAALVSRVLPAKGGGVRVGIRMARLELIVTSGDSVLDAFQFDGRTDEAAGAWIDSKLHALGLKPAGGVKLAYALLDHPAGGRSHELGMLGREVGELSRWFGGPAEALEEFAAKLVGLRPGPGPLLCWPHHFDMATLVRLDADAGESARSVGGGVSEGDEVEEKK